MSKMENQLVNNDNQRANNRQQNCNNANQDFNDVNGIVGDSKVTKVLYNQVSLVIAIAGFVLVGFIYLTNPSKENDTALQLQDARINSQTETIDRITKTQQNDTQELKQIVTMLVDQIQAQQQDLTRLTVIIEERIPKK